MQCKKKSKELFNLAINSSLTEYYKYIKDDDDRRKYSFYPRSKIFVKDYITKETNQKIFSVYYLYSSKL